MPDFPSYRPYNKIHINVFCPEALCGQIPLNIASLSSGAVVAQNVAYYFPVQIYRPVTIANFVTTNGATVAGNVDVGIYRPDGTKVVSLGSTAMAGANGGQVLNIADTALTPGLYYMAFASDSATATFGQYSGFAASGLRLAGAFEQTSAFALPSPATFAAYTRTIVPMLSMTPRAVV